MAMSDDGEDFIHVVVLITEEVLSCGLQVSGLSKKSINRVEKLIRYRQQPTTSVSKIVLGSFMWQRCRYGKTCKQQVLLLPILHSRSQKHKKDVQGAELVVTFSGVSEAILDWG